MGEFIIHRAGAFNVFSTHTDAPFFETALTEAQLRDWIQQETGRRGLEALPPRIERAVQYGCSAVEGCYTLEACIRAALDVITPPMSREQWIARFLTLPGQS